MTASFAFLHGGGQGSWVWEETLAALRQLTRTRPAHLLALDAPGCGSKRGRETANLTVDDVTDELLTDIGAAGLSDVILVGHSQAGTVLPRMAERQPGLFRRLVYLSCCAPLPGQDIQQMIGGGVHGSHRDEVGWPLDPATVTHEQQWAACFCNDMDATATAAFIARLGRDMWPLQTMTATDWRYAHLGAVPSTFILCNQDAILTPPWQLRFARRFKVERIVRIDGGHQVMNSRPQALAELLLQEAAV
jgi:pimeloyl-ACP methyl ester carboxylesterase